MTIYTQESVVTPKKDHGKYRENLMEKLRKEMSGEMITVEEEEKTKDESLDKAWTHGGKESQDGS